MNEYDEILTGWRNQKCIGSCIVLEPYKYEVLVAKAVSGMLAKNANIKIIIIVDSYDTRVTVITECRKSGIDVNKLTIISLNYIRSDINYQYDVGIYVGVNVASSIFVVDRNVKYKLFVITNDKIKANDKIEIYKQYPIINEVDYKNSGYRLSTPVEEYRIGINFAKEDAERYNQLTEFINQTISIFGSLENITYAKVGNANTKQSAENVRQSIAQYNGWNPELDTSIPFNKEIDDIFNPISLLERANVAYNIIRERNDLINNYKNKFDIVLNLLNNELRNKKVLIVSKSGDTANAIADYLNNNNITCGLYHDAIPSTTIFDNNINDYIRYKSGAKKGEVKIFASKSLSTYWLSRFNIKPSEPFFAADNINVLSIKNCSSDELKCNVDAVIFLSCLYANIDEFRYRYTNIKFNSGADIFYKIYINGTNEEKEVLNEKLKCKVKVINKNDSNYFAD